MAAIIPSEFTAKNGKSVKLRSAEPGDALETLALTRHAIETSDYLTYTPGEFDRTRREERRLLKSKLADPATVMVVAEADGQVVALLNTNRDKRKRLSHTIEFGLVVHSDWRGMGLGGAMVKTLLNWARKDPTLERVELRVTDGNKTAKALYRKLGFEEEGRRRLAIRQQDGSYSDDVMMAVFLREHPRIEV